MTAKVVVLVSGGNTGIGYEIVKKLSLENPDTHHILMGTRSLEKGQLALKALGSPANTTLVQLDITQDPSIDKAFETIKSTYGRLDVLVNNAGTAGRDLGVNVGIGELPEGVSLRDVYDHVYQVNVISTGVFTDKMVPLLAQSTLPKIIFITSILGSVGMLKDGFPLRPLPWYSSSKTAVNHLCVWYSRKYPNWKVNVSCPGLVATGLNTLERNEDTDPSKGAINACRLVMEGEDGGSGTFSNTSQALPW